MAISENLRNCLQAKEKKQLRRGYIESRGKAKYYKFKTGKAKQANLYFTAKTTDINGIKTIVTFRSPEKSTRRSTPSPIPEIRNTTSSTSPRIGATTERPR